MLKASAALGDIIPRGEIVITNLPTIDNIPENAFAIIIGAMKCGTSSLYSYLEGHPEICPAVVKEPEFFSINQLHGVQVKKYGDLWHFNKDKHKYALEASTGYTKYPREPDIPKKMHAYGLKPKFIYVIRNPIDRISSHFNYMQREITWDLEIHDKHLIASSNYYLQLEQFRKYFPKENILLLDFDELKNNPRSLLEKTYSFLEISDNYYPTDYEVKNPTQQQTELESSLKKSKFGPVLQKLPESLRTFGKKMVSNYSKPVSKKVLSESQIAYVYDELEESMFHLHESYGVDVSKWGFDIKKIGDQ